jgi:hypothetical protein
MLRKLMTGGKKGRPRAYVTYKDTSEKQNCYIKHQVRNCMHVVSTVTHSLYYVLIKFQKNLSSCSSDHHDEEI